MTPQERELIAEVFDKLATLEGNPRDPEAERVIAEGLRRAPHAIYPLVQTVLVQDEALKVANARINELQGTGTPPEQPRGFLDSMRAGLFGSRSSSVPSVRPADSSAFRAAPAAAQPVAQQVAQPAASAFGGSSFLGTAAAAAAGMIGGGLLLSGIRSMLGSGYGYHNSAFNGTFDSLSGSPMDGGSPWGGSGSDSFASNYSSSDSDTDAGPFDSASSDSSSDSDIGFDSSDNSSDYA